MHSSCGRSLQTRMTRRVRIACAAAASAILLIVAFGRSAPRPAAASASFRPRRAAQFSRRRIPIPPIGFSRTPESSMKSRASVSLPPPKSQICSSGQKRPRPSPSRMCNSQRLPPRSPSVSATHSLPERSSGNCRWTHQTLRRATLFSLTTARCSLTPKASAFSSTTKFISSPSANMSRFP